MVDDTCYFLPFDYREEAELVIDILPRISIVSLARHLHGLDDLRELARQSVLHFED